MRMAVVGGGIAGLSAAWLMSRQHEVWLFEANDYVGGHTNTVDVPGPDGGMTPVDTGFIVFNSRNYPHFNALLEHLGVATRESDMSFSFSCPERGLEWAGHSLDTLFAQRRNLFNPRFVAMALDILRFNRAGKRFLARARGETATLGDFLDDIGVGEALRRHYLLPMAAAIWSCPPRAMLDFPARRFLRFFDNHGLMDLVDRPHWRTVADGGRAYVRRMLPAISGGHHVTTPVRRVRRQASGVELQGDRGSLGRFDHVVIATHADQALAMLENPGFWESTLLGSIRYQRNEAWLHTDPALMPRSRRVWSSWNYLASPEDRPASVSYWMNRLQGLSGDTDWFVTLNPEHPPASERAIRRFIYEHPVFDRTAMRAQGMLDQIQGRNRIWYCGSYCGYGFHEDALHASVEMARAFGVIPPWESPLPGPATETQPSRPVAQADWQTS